MRSTNTTMRPRIETYKGRKLKVRKNPNGRGELEASINGKVLSTPIGGRPEDMDRELGQLRRDVDAMDARRAEDGNTDAYGTDMYPADNPAIQHKQTVALMDALAAAGWAYTSSRFPGNAIFSHPRSGEELPTPDYMRGSRSWPFDTYSKLRQVTFNYTGHRIDAVWTRTSAAPWVTDHSPKVSFKRAIEFINEEWSP